MALAALLLLASPLVESGYSHFYNLEFDQAIADFELAARERPDDPAMHNHLAQALLFREMYRDGALESELVSGANPFLRRPKMEVQPEVERRFQSEIAASLALCERRLRAGEKDTAALYAMGIAYGLRANFHYLVRKAWRDALRDATAGRKAHNRISQIDPANIDARLMQGLHEYIIGSLPFAYRLVGFLAGVRGDREGGLRTVELVARHGLQNRVDAEIMLCALYRRERQPQRALPLLEDLIRRFPRNYLFRMEQSQMYSNLGDKAKALAAVGAVAEAKRRRLPGYADVPWEKIWFQEGTIQFWYGDLEAALENMRKVISTGRELDLGTGVLAWMRIGQIYDLTNRRPEALNAYKNASGFAPSSEAARESRRYLITPYRR